MSHAEFEVATGLDQIDFTNEWDLLAPLRSDQRTARRDVSYTNVLRPAILESVDRESRNQRLRILDVGCGTGEMTRELSKCHEVVGVDPSAVSISIARSKGGAAFEVSTVEAYAEVRPGDLNVAVANMVLMDTPDLLGVLSAGHKLLAPNGLFIATITHPWGWPQYCGYDEATWFDYTKETFIRGPWKISTDIDGPAPLMSTHVHRPLSAYVEAARSVGFVVETLSEIGIADAGRHGEPMPSRVPKFLLMELRRF